MAGTANLNNVAAAQLSIALKLLVTVPYREIYLAQEKCFVHGSRLSHRGVSHLSSARCRNIICI